MTGRKLTEKPKNNLSLAKKNSKGIYVINLETALRRRDVSWLRLETNEETYYISISQAEKLLNFPKGSIRDNLKSKSGNPYRGIYKFKLLPCGNEIKG